MNCVIVKIIYILVSICFWCNIWLIRLYICILLSNLVVILILYFKKYDNLIINIFWKDFDFVIFMFLLINVNVVILFIISG